jgi:hypothetical protein
MKVMGLTVIAAGALVLLPAPKTASAMGGACYWESNSCDTCPDQGWEEDFCATKEIGLGCVFGSGGCEKSDCQYPMGKYYCDGIHPT